MAFLVCAQRCPAAAAALVVLALAGGPGCGGTNDEAKTGAQATAIADEPFEEAPSPYDALPPAVRDAMDKSFTGDLDEMIARRVIRAGVTFNRTHYFIDKGQQRGATYEAVKLFEDELNKAFHQGLMEVSKGALARSAAAAELVQKGSAAIVTLYTAVLALAFSVSDRPLPLRGLLPAVFLGLAVAFATGYVAYVSRIPNTPGPSPSPLPEEYQLNRTNAFISWVATTALTRAMWLRRAVVSLAIGVLLLPIPFIAFPLTEASAGTPIEWPPPPTVVDDATTELYKAQVAETARLRQAQEKATKEDEGGLVALVALFGVFLVLTVPLSGWKQQAPRAGGGIVGIPLDSA
jgi:hypothetical protein